MSTVRTNNILDASGGNTATINSMTPTADSLQGFRNRIINGAMVIDQRNAGASVTSGFAVDRWNSYFTQASKVTLQQNAGSVTPPTGYQNYYGVTSSSAYSVTSSDLFEIYQNIEGYNVSDLGWGAVGAAAVTISFWVRSSLTGTFSGSFVNAPTFNRSYPFTYTISAANTWEQKTITVAGDTSGTWGKTNGTGVSVIFCIGAGSTNLTTAGAWAAGNYAGATGSTSVVGTNGATWYITGVQLEKGSVATPFERRDYGRELALCQRYCYLHVSGTTQAISMGSAFSATRVFGNVSFPVTMRTAPTISASSGSGYYQFYYSGTTANFSAPFLYMSSTTNYIFEGTTTGVTTGVGGWFQTANASASIAFSSEL